MGSESDEDLDFLDDQPAPSHLEVLTWHARTTSENVRELRSEVANLAAQVGELRGELERRNVEFVKAMSHLFKLMNYGLCGVAALVALVFVRNVH